MPNHGKYVCISSSDETPEPNKLKDKEIISYPRIMNPKNDSHLFGL